MKIEERKYQYKHKYAVVSLKSGDTGYVYSDAEYKVGMVIHDDLEIKKKEY